MLAEVVPTRQIAGEPHRRWFMDEAMDLIVWNDESGAFLGFQLAWKEPGEEKALAWMQGQGFAHYRVDDGEGRPGHYKMAPILLADGLVDAGSLAARFRRSAAELPAGIVEFVLERIGQYGRGEAG
jgi:hypothetical protein